MSEHNYDIEDKGTVYHDSVYHDSVYHDSVYHDFMRHSGPIVAEHAGITVIDCVTCGYAHQYPLPQQAEIDSYYNNDVFYTTHSPTNWFSVNAAEHTAGLWRQQYTRQQRMLCGTWQTLVDIGCGDGNFLRSWLERGGYGYGIEPSAKARALAQYNGVHVYTDYSEALARTGYVEYDQCTRAALVIEHVHSPEELLMQMDVLTGKCGRMMLILPNEFNPLQNKVRKQLGQAWFVQKPHLNYFSKASLRAFMTNNGYRVVKQTGTFPMELFWLMGYKYIGNDSIGQKCHLWRLNFETRYKSLAFKLYDWWYNWFGWGRETIIVSEKCYR